MSLGLVPHVVVSDAPAFIEFCKQAFGAEEGMRMPAQDGKRIMHAEITIMGSRMMVCDEFPEFDSTKSAKGLGATPVTFNLGVQNADAAWERALQAGAQVKMPLDDQFWGDRYGQITDPFGNVWAIAQPKEQLTAEQIAERAAKMGM